MVIKMNHSNSSNKSSELGQIPKEWKISALKDVLRIGYGKNQRAVEVEKSEIPILGTGGIIGYAKQPLFDKPSVLIGRKGTIDKPRYIDKPFWTIDTLFYTEIDLKIASPKFIYYLFQTIDWYKYNEATGVPSLSANNVSKITFRNPPLKEQQKIAEILSAADEQIEITEQLIQKTKELKKGLMQQLFTKGLGHTQFKASDLGEIPIEWDVVQFNDICTRIIVGIASSTSQYYTTEKAVPILRNQNIKENKIQAKDVLYITKEFDEMNYKKRLRKGDILTVRTGYPGLTAVVPSEFEEAQSFTTLISSPNPVLANSHYLAYYMNSEIGKKDLTGLSAGGAQQNLNVGSLSTFKLKLPPLTEQSKIVDILFSMDNQIEVYEKEKEKQIELKKALMQQLLTGKIRVTV